MNTIYDNTFVLGQTSATNFVAGPGIKIDEPSAGTVRIGNDETVLWQEVNFASNLASAVTLSESVKNFSKVMITFIIETTTSSYPTPATKIFDMEALAALNNYIVTFDMQFIPSDNNLILRASRVTMNGTTFSEMVSKQWYSGGVATPSNALHIIRVVGINRISGGNE